MESTKPGSQIWAIAVYMLGTNRVSSMKLYRDLDITQKSAGHLMHRIRKPFEAGGLKYIKGINRTHEAVCHSVGNTSAIWRTQTAWKASGLR